MHAQLQQYDTATGAEIQGTVVLIPAPQRNGFTEGFAMMNQAKEQVDFLSNAIKRFDTYRVFLQLCGKLQTENYLVISQTEIANNLSMKRPNVSRAVKELLDLRIILKGTKIGVQQTYRLNPNFGWKGKPKKHHEALRTMLQKSGLQIIEGGTPK